MTLLLSLRKRKNINQTLCDSLVVMKLIIGYYEDATSFYSNKFRYALLKFVFESRSIDLVLAALDIVEPPFSFSNYRSSFERLIEQAII